MSSGERDKAEDRGSGDRRRQAVTVGGWYFAPQPEAPAQGRSDNCGAALGWVVAVGALPASTLS